ncbi:MAG: hypothetical protein ACPGU7_04235 [Gammaproteobacteria bacterium]
MSIKAPSIDPRWVDLPEHSEPGPDGVNPSGVGEAPRATLAKLRPGLAGLLRVLGSIVIVASTGMFLFQRWDGGDDLHRFLLLLSYTVTLTGLGFATNRWLHEPKSARVFIGLGLIAVSTTVTVLAALLYGQWAMPDQVLYPDHFLWQGVEDQTLFITTALSAVLLAAQARVGFMVLAREPSAALTGLFLMNAVLLMIPVREPWIVTGIALAGFMFSLRALGRLRARHLSLRTPAALSARVAVLLPLAIMAGRSAYLYAAGAVAVACFALLAYASLRQLAKLDGMRPNWRNALLISATLPALVAAVSTTSAASHAELFAESYSAVFIALVFGVFMSDLHRLATAGQTRFASLGIIGALIAALFLLFVTAPSANGAVALVIALLGLIMARAARLRLAFHSALAVLAVAVIRVGISAYANFSFDHTLGLAIGGIALVLGAALIERHGRLVRTWLRMPTTTDD